MAFPLSHLDGLILCNGGGYMCSYLLFAHFLLLTMILIFLLALPPLRQC